VRHVGLGWRALEIEAGARSELAGLGDVYRERSGGSFGGLPAGRLFERLPERRRVPEALTWLDR
jgi:hypothetical protein